MPLYEVEQRFTSSELAIVGWRSQETAYLMDKQMKKGQANAGPPVEAGELMTDPSLPYGLPERFFNKDGELDLRQVTGAEALRFLRTQGVNVPFVPPRALEKNRGE